MMWVPEIVIFFKLFFKYFFLYRLYWVLRCFTQGIKCFHAFLFLFILEKQFSHWQFCYTIAQFTFTDSIFVETVLLIGWESRKVSLMEKKQNWNYIYDGILCSAYLFLSEKVFFSSKKEKKIQIFLYFSLSDKKKFIIWMKTGIFLTKESY